MKKTLLTLLVALFATSAFSQLITKPKMIPCVTTEMEEWRRARYNDIATVGQFEAWMDANKAYVQEVMANYPKANATNEPIIFRIPVVFHIIHDGIPNPAPTETVTQLLLPEDDIPYERILKQMEVLNNDFQKKNADTSATIPQFKGIAANIQIQFELAVKDPDGNILEQPGYNRVMWPGLAHTGLVVNQEIELLIKPQTIWDPKRYFNVWTVRFAESTPVAALLGYAQFPEGSGLQGMPNGVQSANTDGVVMNPIVVGTEGAADYWDNKSRTLTHEVGHWLGLRHSWGDGGCAVDDFVEDTPNLDGSSSGCQLGRTTCGGLNNVQNYMDYTDGSCQTMFTQGQKLRMHIVMLLSPRRKELPSSDALPDISTSVITATNKVEDAFKLYPNPSTGPITLQFDSKFIQTGRIEILDRNGKMVYSQIKDFTRGAHTLDIDLNNYTTGLYTIRFNSPLQSSTTKFIKN